MPPVKKNILFVSSAPNVYGGEINLIDLLRSIDRERYNIHCLYNPSSRFDTYDLSEDVNLVPFRFPDYSKKNILKIISVSIRLLRILIINKVNLIYINVSKDLKYFGYLSKYLKIPTILHVHVNEPDESLRWFNANKANRILFPSKSTMDSVLEHSIWIDIRKCYYVHNAVDLTAYYPQPATDLRSEFSFNNNYPVVGIVGQLKFIKGQHLFLDMAKNFISNKIKSNFLVVGEDTTVEGAYKKFLMDQVANPCMNENIVFAGFRKDVPKIMSLCDLIVVPSIHEPFGRVVIEAMACGTPVVASNIDGIPEIYENGNGGLFFQPGSVNDLTKKVNYFFDNPEWWEKQRKIAVEICKERFSQTIHTKKIEDHIEEVLSFSTGNKIEK